jgi:hypothetical protein
MCNLFWFSSGGCAYLSVSSYLIWIFVMESFKLPMIVLMREPSHDELFYSPPKKQNKSHQRKNPV